MIESYSVNPNLGKNVVTTVNGNKEYRANCRMWKGQYFIKEKDCFEIDGTWYRGTSELIVKDYETGKMLLKKNASKLINGIVDYDDEKPVMGYYTVNLAKNTMVVNSMGFKYNCISDQVACKGGNAENIIDGMFYSQDLNKVEKKPAKKSNADWFIAAVDDIEIPILNEDPVPLPARIRAQFIGNGVDPVDRGEVQVDEPEILRTLPNTRPGTMRIWMNNIAYVLPTVEAHTTLAQFVRNNPGSQASTGNLIPVVAYNKLVEDRNRARRRGGEVARPVARAEGAGNVLGSAKSYGELTQYGVEDNKDKFEETVRIYNEQSVSYSKEVKRYARFLEGRTFGIEYETKQGFVPQRILSRCGLIPLRDGSLHGGVELTSIPLEGAKGLQITSTTCNELSKRCSVDKDCSLHIHFGTLKENRLFTVALYQLGRRIQEEMLQMFPYYKTDHTGIKEKNYCQKLRPLTTKLLPKKTDKESFGKYIDYYYTRIMTFLLEGSAPDRNYNHDNAAHPVQQKWNRTSRYYWMNFLPLLLSPRRTVEFRLHQGTLSPIKTINWLFMCNAILSYANAHAKDILQSKEVIPIKTILNWYKDTYKTDTANFLSEYLIEYFESRKAEFSAAFNKNDYLCEWDLKEDRFYKFNHKGVSSLF